MPNSNSLYHAFEELPPHMQGPVSRYIAYGIPGGGFLNAIVSNDLTEACAKADDINIHQIPNIVRWFWNYAPSACWGSPKKVEDWIASKAAARREDLE